jgi:hypothetical protein
MMGALPLHGWYFKQNGQTIGPLSQAQVQELLTVGQLLPRQVVFNRGAQRLLFLRADVLRSSLTAAVG